MTIYSLISEVRAKGIILWQENGQLKIKAPKGAMTDDIREQIARHKPGILDFLSQASATGKAVPPILPVNREEMDVLPLSFLQERLWIISRLNPENTGYNIPVAFIVRGKLDISLWNKAFNVLIARHESLRTVFPDHGGRAQQKIMDRLGFELDFVDLGGTKSGKSRYAEAKRLCEADAVTPFDLAAGPLIRGKMIRIDAQEHIFMLNIHHIISDDWSANVMFKELFPVIDALREGKEADLPALPVQYADYSIWQRQWFEKDGELGRQLSYWQRKLAGVPESPDMATDYPRPAVQNFEGDSQAFTMDTQLTALLKNLAEQRGCTLYMLLLAIFKVQMFRYTGQGDICIGSAISNRQPEETRGLIGMFVNTLALRTQIESEDTFPEVLDKVKATCVEAYEHQDVPFEKIVDALQVRRNPAFNPLFRVMVTQNIPLSLPGKDIEPFHLDRHSSKFDMTVEFTEDGNGIAGLIEYCTSLFKRETIERMTGHFITLCRAVTACPDTSITDLDLLTTEEKQQVVTDFNNTRKPYEKGRCIHHLFAEQVRQNSGEIAVISGEEQWTYQQLYDKSNVLALYLQSMGVKQDSLVGVCMDRSADMLVALMAVLQSGGAYLPLDPNYPEDRIAFMLEDSQASVVLTRAKLKKKFGKLKSHHAEFVALDKQWAEIMDTVSGLNDKNIELIKEVTSGNLAYIIYTSGSTGKPKGVAIEHRSAVAMINWAKDVFNKDELAGVLASTSVCFDLSVFEIFLPLCAGGKVILVPDALALRNFPHREAVTLINTVPSVMGELVRLKGAVPDTVLTVNLAGEPLSPALVDKIYDNSKVRKVYDLYGPSEDTTYSTFSLRAKNGPQTIGRPISNTQAYILDRFNNPLPIGIPGELHLAGSGLARGYLNRPELTAEKFIPNPFNPGTAMYKTGDLARWQEDGTIEYLGRIDRQVKIRGFRIETGEIEYHLDTYPKIRESAVVVQGEGSNKRLVAFYVAEPTGSDTSVGITNEELNRYLKQFLSDYMLPYAFVNLESLPMTQNGKIDRRVLENTELDTEVSRDHSGAGDDIETALVNIWAEILTRNPETVGVNDNFFDLGGNSVNVVTLAARIEQKMQCVFSPVDLFKYSTVRSIGRYIKEKNGAGPGENTVPEKRGPVPLTSGGTKNAPSGPDYPGYYEDSLAIIGISCHFPGAEDHWQFWKNLVECRESVNLLSREEAERLKVPSEILNNPDYVPLKPWLDGKEFFDPEFFRISSGNAALMDPQFRQLLQHSWKAVEDAGYRSEDIANTSVFMSASNNFYQSLAEKLSEEGHVMKDSGEFVSWVLAQGGTIPTMISYQLGLRGPSAFVHSNCSSSMTGLYYAFQSLQSGDVDYALVGAATLSASLGLGYLQIPGMNFSGDGHCKAFDAEADGMVDGEGVGVILVKRAADAIRDGDHIYSLIRGISINNDGADKAGFYAPGVSGQTSVIRSALEKTGINPESISYVEAHGTGTALGDPIEVRAISEAYAKYTGEKQFCAIGSVKPNIGHLDTAAGLAGCIKLAMSLYHKKFPAIINYSNPNPQIDFENSPFYVSDREESWTEEQYPKRAAISSFGIGGTNAHAILEEYIHSETSADEVSDSGWYAIPLSARKEDALKEYAQKLLAFLEEKGHDKITLSEMAFTLQTGRMEMEYRVVFVVKTLRELLDELQAFIKGKKSDRYFRGEVSPGKKPVESLEEDEDYQELIKHWFAKKKVGRLARLWATGTGLDWKLLYDGAFPLRVSLPAYPFARVRYWIDTSPSKSRATAAGTTTAATVLHPLLHTNTSDFNRQGYSSSFSGNEFFLADHRIDGQKVLPAVAYMEMVCAAVMTATSGQFGSSMLELNDMVWIQPVTVTGPKQIDIDLSVGDNGQIQYKILSKDATEVTVHSEGKAGFAERPLPGALHIAELERQMNRGSMDSAQVYAMFDKTGTQYGPAHRGIKNIRIGERQVLAELGLPGVAGDTLNEYILHPSLMDGALQAANILFDHLDGHTVRDVLPFALKSLYTGSGCTENMFVWARLAEGSKPGDTLVKLDMDLCDPEGNICVQMHGFSFRMIAADRDGRKGRDHRANLDMAAPVWQPLPLVAPDKTGRVAHDPPLEQHYVALCEVRGIRIEQLRDLLPGRECFQIAEKKHDIAGRFAGAALECFERIQTIFKGKPKRKVLFQLVITDSPEQSVFAGLSGLFRTAAMENPNFIGQVIQVDEKATAEQLAQSLLDNRDIPGESWIKYIQGIRHVPQWQSLEPVQPTPDIVFKDKGVYLITGGLGGLGTLFAKEILQQVKNARVILTGRSELTDEKKKILDTLTSPGVSVAYHQADVCNTGQVDQLIASVMDRYGQLNGVIHSAGIISDNFILKKTAGEFNKVLEPKVRGTLNLDMACRDTDLDFMVLFSSDSAFGSIGQSDYAAANGFMDRFALYRNQLMSAGQRQGLTVAVNWPLWQDGGMKPAPALLDIQQKTTEILPMSTPEGIRAFYRCLELKHGQVAVTVKDMSRMESGYPGHSVTHQEEEPVPENTSVLQQGNTGHEDDLSGQVEEFLKKRFSELFKLPVHQIDPEVSLENYGIDSILMIDITSRLEKTFGPLSKTLLFEYHTIRELADYFVEEFEEKLAGLFAISDNGGKKTAAPASQPESRKREQAKPVQFRTGRFYHPGPAKTGISNNGYPKANPVKEELIAIVGLSGRYPESPDIKAYWDNLRNGKDCIIEIPKERWDWREYFSEDKTRDGVHYSKYGGFITGVDEFDPRFFNISPKEAEILDPQERLFLQHAWMAIEDAGYTRAALQVPHGHNLPGQVGVYVGVMYSEYQLFGAEISQRGQRMGFANSMADIANRVSFVMNIHGPSFTVDTMCSSSLTTIHLACQDLKSGRTDMAIAGGVNVSVHPNKYLLLSSGQYISTTGHCHSFGADGDGYIPGEGVGAVVLKRLSDAEKSGDHIYGIIRGSGLNHGGKPSGYTVPNPQAQSALIRQVLEESGTDPRHVSYIEAHGTGTPLGDPIEINALTKAFYQKDREGPVQHKDRSFCMIGSVKSNIGHCESAAGIAGLTKILLQMKYGQIAPSLHSGQLNPNIDFDKTPFVVNQNLKAWEQPVVEGKNIPRIAGISSFGAGGSNAHIILEEYSGEAEPVEENRKVVVPLSARTPAQLRQKVIDLTRFIRYQEKPVDLVSMAYTLQVGREAMEERLGFIVDSPGQLLELLETFIKSRESGENTPVENVYQGQVKQHRETVLIFSRDDDMRATINKWTAQHKLEKLLDLWVKGLDLDWQKLYGDTSPRRMSLPAYPFAKERYWWNDHLDDKGASLQQQADRQDRTGVIHPLLHINTSDMLQQRYSSTFSGKEPFFADDDAGIGNEEKVLPGEIYLEMARVAVEKAIPTGEETGMVELHNVVLGEPFIVTGNNPIHVSLFAKDDKQVSFEFYSNSGEEEIIHCQGHAVFGDPQEIRGITFREDTPVQEISSPELREPKQITIPPQVTGMDEVSLPVFSETVLKKPSGILLTAPGDLPSGKMEQAPGRVPVVLPDMASGFPLHNSKAPSASLVGLYNLGNGIYSIRLTAESDYTLSRDAITQLVQALHRAQQEPSMKVLLLRGSAARFLHGGRAAYNEAIGQQLFQTIASFPYPVIAVMEGNAGGAGFLLGALCDFMICNEDATYFYTDPQGELYPDAPEEQLLKERFGTAPVYDFMYVSTKATGRELKEKGWGFPVLKRGEIEEYTQKLAFDLAGKPQRSLRLLKQHLAGHIVDLVNTLVTVNPPANEKQPGKAGHGITSLVNDRKSELYEENILVAIREKIKNGPARPELKEGAPAAMTSVALKSKVITATVYPEDILVVKMEDREAKNMFSDALTRGIMEIFEHIGQTPVYKAVILTGFDNYFASGGTKEDLLAIQEGKARFTDTKFYHLAMECEVPVIAAMQGHAIGAGWSYGMFADFVLFSEESRYLSPYMNFGFTPGAGATFILPGKIGLDLARETLLAGRGISGSELKDRGAGLQVLPRQHVLPAAMELAGEIAKNPREQLVVAKRELTQHLHGKLEETYQQELAMHDETFVGQSETLEQIRKYFGQGQGDISQNGHTVPTIEQHHEQLLSSTDIPHNVSLPELTARLREYLAQELHMQEEEIDEGEEFIDLGLDSITGVTWVRKINEKYGLSIEATKIYGYPTLTRFAGFVKDELARQGPLSGSPDTHKPAATISQAVSHHTNRDTPVPVTPPKETDTLLTVRADLSKLLAEELHIKEEEIDEDEEFIDLGLDSITGVTWIRKINEKYKLAIEATKVYSYPTLNDFSRFVKAEAEKHGTLGSIPVSAPAIQKSNPADIPVYVPETISGKITFSPATEKKLTSWRKGASQKVVSGPSARSKAQPVAIVGMAGQFPQAGNVEEFWDNIARGMDCIREVSKTRWDIDVCYSEGEPVAGKTNCKWMGALEEYDLFDPLFFNISPTEAENMDPQQRLFLQACWHGIENAGYDAKTLSGSNCGVFVGAGAGDYQLLSRELQVSAKGFTGTANSILAARISYFLNLQGPCLTLDTACSSSLVAIATACDSLVSGNSDLALAGGVCVMATPDLHIKSAQSGMLSPDGRCHTFDDRANGFVPGEGVGVVVLKRLEDARKDRDNILGVIEGWGVNQDGKTNGITAPNPESQKRLMQDVYDKFRIDPADIQLVEAHGTGTKLGDPIEVAALVDSFGRYTGEKNYCAIGSVKSNIGHCMAAAGVAGVVKATMALKNRKLPPTINFTQLNEHINLKNTPFYVNDRFQDWNGSGKHLAAVSSFGFSGTNAHLVISEYVPARVAGKPVTPNPEVIIPLSAGNTDRLMQKAVDLLDHIRKYPSVDLHEMAYTLQAGRTAMDDRVGFIVNSTSQLADKLQAYIDGQKGTDGVFQGQVNRNREGMQFINQDTEVREALIDKWFGNNQLSRLLGAWVKGLSFDWNRLYGPVRPQRIGLPVYPFAKERYWVENKTPESRVSHTEILPMIHPLLHRNTSNFSQQCYTSTFNGKEFFLEDHKVQLIEDGSVPQKVLPGVAYLEMARAAVEDAMSLSPGSGMAELRNVVWVRPVVVTEQQQVSIALSVVDDRQIDFEVYSPDDGQKVIHCQGQAVLSSSQPPAQINIKRLAQEMNNGEQDGDNTYKTLIKMGLHYGPAHQGIRVIHRGEGQALAQLQLPETAGKYHGDGFVLHPGLTDSALQAAVGFTGDPDRPSGRPSLPFALETLRIFSPYTKTMYSWVRYAQGDRADGKLSRLDIDLMDEDGNISAQIRGLTSRVPDNDIKQYHRKMTGDITMNGANGNGNGSSFDETFYETVIESILDNKVSIDEALDLE